MAPEANDAPATAEPTLKAMTVDEANDYLQKVLAGEVRMKGLEAEAFKRFQAMGAEQNKASERLTKINQETTQLRDGVQRLQGQLDAYAQLIVSAEDTRRDSAKVEPAADVEAA